VAPAGGSRSGAVAQLEQELSQFRSLMEGLSSEANKLTQTMHSMKPLPTTADAAGPSSARGRSALSRYH